MSSTLVWIILGVYSGVCLVLFWIQEKFLFHPEKLPPDFQFQYPGKFREVEFQVDKDAVLHGIWFECLSGQEVKGLVIYLHGNTRSVKGWGKYAEDFLKWGYEVLMVDYRGFGKSTGSRSEKALFQDLQIVFSEVAKGVSPEKIIIYGRSMGSGFAARLASQNAPAALILHAPYYSLAQVAKRYLFFIPLSLLLRYPIRTDKWISYVRCPVYIFHGTKDKLIPIETSRKLVRLVQSRVAFIPIPGANHHNISQFKEYHAAIEKILHSPDHAWNHL